MRYGEVYTKVVRWSTKVSFVLDFMYLILILYQESAFFVSAYPQDVHLKLFVNIS